MLPGTSSAERKAAAAAFACHFTLMLSYYILRPLRDTVATYAGVENLPQLFTATFIGTVLASVLYMQVVSRLRLAVFLSGTFWFWLCNVLLFAVLFHLHPTGRWTSTGFYIWFSIANLFMVSVFWSFIVDTFTTRQAGRVFAFITAGGAFGAIAGPLLTRRLIAPLGMSGMLLLAAGGFAIVILQLRGLLRARSAADDVRECPLNGGGFLIACRELVASPHVLSQTMFMTLMTWVNTIAYYCQTHVIEHSYADLASRTRAIADIDLVVNAASAAILLLGLGGFVRRCGVTAALLLNPVLLALGFLVTLLSPTLLAVQALQIVRRTGQYAIARPSREICFTVIERSQRYQAKNLVDTVFYRLGDMSSAWMLGVGRSLGDGLPGAALAGFVGCLVWGASAAALGRRFRSSAANADADRAETRHRAATAPSDSI